MRIKKVSETFFERAAVVAVHRNQKRLLTLFVLVLAVGRMGRAKADDAPLPPPDRAIEAVIDEFIDLGLQRAGVVAAPPADDANFVRRATLDLAGRIPTTAETQAYVQSSDPGKRALLVDRLIASPDFNYHQRNELDALLLPGQNNGEWREYLLKAVQENRSWSQLFREVILGREDNPAEKPALAFLKARAKNVDDLTNDTSKLFFGVSINCAKCHDHPLVLDWTQDHYFGMASFFNRTYLTKKNFLAERDDGQLKFRTTAGVEKEARVMFLTGVAVDDPPAPQLTEEQKQAEAARRKEDENRETPPAPAGYSRRAQIVELALKPDANGFFTRSFVNRFWHRLLGYGLVMPIDQMHSANKPSHPELLAWLARDALYHNYDMRRLVRGIVLSRAYGRSSRYEGPGDRPVPRHFAVAAVKPLTPMQYALSLQIATQNPAQLEAVFAKGDDWANRRRDYENHAAGFANQLEMPGENFQVGVNEALLFSNGPQVQREYLSESGDRLVGALKGATDRQQAVQTAFLTVYARPAEPDELDAVLKYLSAREDRLAAGYQQVVWSLIASGEFRFNY